MSSKLWNLAEMVLVRFIPLILAAAFCGSCKKGQASGPQAVRIGYFANVTHAQAVLGVEGGEYAKLLGPDVKVEGKVFNAGPSLIEALFAGEIDIGYVGPGPALNAHAKSHGQGIRVIAGAAADGVLIVARSDSGIKTMADLKGRNIATPQLGNTQDISAKHYLKSVLGQSDVSNVLPIDNKDQRAAMKRGLIDAAWVPEPWGSRLIKEEDAVLVGEEKDLWPDKTFELTVVVTRPKFLAEHRDLVEKVLAAHRELTARMNANLDPFVPELSEALFRLNSSRLSPGTLADSLRHVRFNDEPSEATFEAQARWAYDLEIADTLPRLDGLFDLSVLGDLRKKNPITGAVP